MYLKIKINQPALKLIGKLPGHKLYENGIGELIAIPKNLQLTEKIELDYDCIQVELCNKEYASKLKMKSFVYKPYVNPKLLIEYDDASPCFVRGVPTGKIVTHKDKVFPVCRKTTVVKDTMRKKMVGGKALLHVKSAIDYFNSIDVPEGYMLQLSSATRRRRSKNFSRPTYANLDLYRVGTEEELNDSSLANSAFEKKFYVDLFCIDVASCIDNLKAGLPDVVEVSKLFRINNILGTMRREGNMMVYGDDWIEIVHRHTGLSMNVQRSLWHAFAHIHKPLSELMKYLDDKQGVELSFSQMRLSNSRLCGEQLDVVLRTTKNSKSNPKFKSDTVCFTCLLDDNAANVITGFINTTP
jgi:hypothetical protein